MYCKVRTNYLTFAANINIKRKMKKLTNYVTMFAVAATLLLSACGGKDKIEPEKPTPKVNFKTTAGYTFASATVAGDSNIKAGIIINHEYKIKRVLFQISISGSSPITVKDSVMSSKVVDMDFMRQVITTPGTEVWTITATDENDKVGTASFTVTIGGADQILIDYVATGAGQQNRKIYRKQSSKPESALNLDDLVIYSAANADDGVKDVYDNTVGTGDAYVPVWASKTGTTFVKVTGTLDYSSTVNYSQIVNYFNSKTPTTVSQTIVKDNMYVVKGGVKNRYYLVYVINVSDVVGFENDHCEIKVKTIDITK